MPRCVYMMYDVPASERFWCCCEYAEARRISVWCNRGTTWLIRGDKLSAIEPRCRVSSRWWWFDFLGGKLYIYAAPVLHNMYAEKCRHVLPRKLGWMGRFFETSLFRLFRAYKKKSHLYKGYVCEALYIIRSNASETCFNTRAFLSARGKVPCKRLSNFANFTWRISIENSGYISQWLLDLLHDDDEDGKPL